MNKYYLLLSLIQICNGLDEAIKPDGHLLRIEPRDVRTQEEDEIFWRDIGKKESSIPPRVNVIAFR